MAINIKFWGVRGSVPSPLTPNQVSLKVKQAIELAKQGLPIPFEIESTYGGNTTCVEVKCDNELFILDMGTGVRELGKVQLQEAFKTKTLNGTILQSHVHWDHIQGFPFWGPLYLPRTDFSCNFDFFGGKQWDSQLDLVYRAQMDSPNFPVNLQELEQTAMHMNFQTIYDGWIKIFSTTKGLTLIKNPTYPSKDDIKVTARKLNHPQETFGYRIEYQDKSIAFTTDHEPYYGNMIPKSLAALVKDVDIWITDCQYTLHQYLGMNGSPQRGGWGHSLPDYIALVAKECGVKKVITTHHDPDSNDFAIKNIALTVQDDSDIETIAAWEGLELSI